MTEKRIFIGASFDEVPHAGFAARSVCAAEGVAESEAALFELAVVEAANNAVEHGGTNGPVEVVVRAGADTLEAEVFDGGAAIDVAALTREQDDLPVSRERLAEGGRGLMIIRGVADVVTFERVGDRNRIQFRRQRRGTGAV